MYVLITCSGTRGDVQPYAALAGALVHGGHRATLATAERFHDLAPAASQWPRWAPRCSG
jgi:UDP:flavonoid glycosyltransferase YjiC (YdhE family)